MTTITCDAHINLAVPEGKYRKKHKQNVKGQDLERLLQQGCDEELALTVHCPGCPHLEQQVFLAVREGSFPRTEKEQRTSLAQPAEEQVIVVSLPSEPVPCLLTDVAAVKEKVQASPASVTSSPKKPSPAARPVRFPDSGSVFAELLREHDLMVVQEEAKAKKEAVEREATKKAAEEMEAEHEEASSWSSDMPPIRRRLPNAMPAVRILLWASMLTGVLAQLPTPETLLGRVLEGTVVAVVLVSGCCWLVTPGPPPSFDSPWVNEIPDSWPGFFIPLASSLQSNLPRRSMRKRKKNTRQGRYPLPSKIRKMKTKRKRTEKTNRTESTRTYIGSCSRRVPRSCPSPSTAPAVPTSSSKIFSAGRGADLAWPPKSGGVPPDENRINQSSL